MSDNTTLPAGTQDGDVYASDDIAGVKFQRVKLVHGADGVNAGDVSSANGLPTEVVAALPAGTNAIGKLAANSGVDIGDVDITSIAAGDNNIGNVDIVTVPTDPFGANADAASATGSISAKLRFIASTGIPVTGTVTVGSHAVTNAGTFAVQNVSGGLTQGMVDETGSSAVDAAAVGGGTPHDSVDSGNPIKMGAKAANALPTAVANADRANLISDLFGRLMVCNIDPAQQVWKSANYTTTQTGTAIWDPTSGKKIAINYIAVSAYGTTAARVILWFGANGDTTYSAGTDQLVWAGSFAPSATVKAGAIIQPSTPIFCTTADNELHITTDAGISIDVTVYGYEW